VATRKDIVQDREVGKEGGDLEGSPSFLTNPVTALKMVVFPAPFGPIKLTISFLKMVKSTESTAFKPPNLTVNCWTFISSFFVISHFPSLFRPASEGVP
jgi:hypothetical protein